MVAVVGGEVVLVDEKRTGIDHEGAGGIKLEGAAQKIVWVSGDPMTGSLYVDPYDVFTRAGETSIRKGNRSLTLEDLENGDQVHVRGVFENGNVFAHEIKLQEEDDTDASAAKASCTFADPDRPGKILICHNGMTLSVSPDAWPDHSAHGDDCGPCS